MLVQDEARHSRLVWRCGLCEEDRCVLCDREEVEDVLHF